MAGTRQYRRWGEDVNSTGGGAGRGKGGALGPFSQWVEHPPQSTLTVLAVECRCEHSQQPSHGHRGHELLVAVEGVECEGALPKVSQPLHNEEAGP